MKSNDFAILQTAGLNYFEVKLRMRELVRQAKAVYDGGLRPPCPPTEQKEKCLVYDQEE